MVEPTGARGEVEIVEVAVRAVSDSEAQLTFRLSSAPEKTWLTAFYLAPVRYSGPGTLRFMRLPKPTVDDEEVRWTVPSGETERATGYVQQRVDHANSARSWPRVAPRIHSTPRR